MTAPLSIRRARLTVIDGDPAADSLTRVRAADLGAAQRERRYLRADAVRDGRDPSEVVAALEVDVVLDERAADARAAYARLESAGDTVTYVGTPAGLGSLIDDVYAAEVADAVVLRPLGGARTAALIEGLLAA
ncbi:hypothetical protein P0W64_15870 [Tsukamurella sp. 8F]|uniref:hypothetical protein n=1 Tax=unclassified Tsukamurella TaxID=2633480 RepID=UPI0023B9D219|nr:MULTISPECIES: hypothetical protein [unclassified Tsukamurella]MDF0530932.1 hypothetical protein [Tsukamurella sp. 8J]MDF0588257.1 hypothetical protein [Tsukamurella sp. 8F]